MKITFDIGRIVPKYLLADRNGRAVAKAIEAAFQYVAGQAENGLEILNDVDKMPEWRLDEYAGELGCLYDYNATVEQKRYWLKNAQYLSSVMGTKQAIYNFLEGYFQMVDIEEFWQYGGDPFHFRVIVSGTQYDETKINWARKAILAMKNVRSVLDSVTIETGGEIIVSADTEWYPIPQMQASEYEITGANDTGDWEPIHGEPARTDSGKTDTGVTG